MNGGQTLDRMIADRAARNKRIAFWNDRAADMERRRKAAANDNPAARRAV